MGQPEPPEPLGLDLGVLRTPKGAILGAELALSLLVVGLLAPPAAPTLGPALLLSLVTAGALGGRLLRPRPRLPHGAGPCLDVLRAAAGALGFGAVGLVALASSRDALAAVTFVSVEKNTHFRCKPRPFRGKPRPFRWKQAYFLSEPLPPYSQTFSLAAAFLFAFDAFATFRRRQEAAPA